MKCLKCGNIITENDTFCAKCGEKIDWMNVYGCQFREGDMGAYDKIYKNSYYWVRKQTWQMLCNHESEVDDEVQDIFLKLYEKINLFDPQKGAFRAWFNTLIRNELLDKKRKIETHQGKDIMMSAMENEEMDGPIEFETNDLSSMPEIQMDQKETSRLIRDILNELPEEQSTCLMMFYLEQMKQEEIADALGISKGTVKSRVHYGKARVEEKVKELERQGTKLRSIAPFTFFLYLLHTQEGAFLQTPSNISASHIAGKAAEGIISKNTATQAIGKNTAAQAAKSAVSAGGKIAGKSIVTKTIIGVVATAVVGTGGVVGYKKIVQKEPETVVEETRDAGVDGTKPESAESEISDKNDTSDTNETLEKLQLTDSEASQALNLLGGFIDMQYDKPSDTYRYPCEVNIEDASDEEIQKEGAFLISVGCSSEESYDEYLDNNEHGEASHCADLTEDQIENFFREVFGRDGVNPLKDGTEKVEYFDRLDNGKIRVWSIISGSASHVFECTNFKEDSSGNIIIEGKHAEGYPDASIEVHAKHNPNSEFYKMTLESIQYIPDESGQ